MDKRERTIERGIHPPKIHQQTHHGHTNSSRLIILQLILENLARLATPGHRIHVNIREIHALLVIRLPRKHLGRVLEHQLQELVLDVLAPQRNAILLLEMLDLIARVDRPDCPICLSSRTDRHIGCAAVGGVLGDGFRWRKRVVRDHTALDVGHVGLGKGTFKCFDRSNNRVWWEDLFK